MRKRKGNKAEKRKEEKKHKCLFTRVSFAHAAAETIVIVFERSNRYRIHN